MKTVVLLLGLGCLFTFSLGAAPPVPAAPTPGTKATEFYVATTGSDENPGTKQKPFATLEKAKNALLEEAKTCREPIRVLLREGTYYLNHPLELGVENSGTAEAPVTYAASPSERVTL